MNDKLDWEKLFKRYVIDDAKTPYFIAVDRLTQSQARYELFAYTLFVGVLFVAIGIASISTELPHGGALGVPVYALAMVAAAVIFGTTRHPWAASACASAPVAALVYFVLYGFHPNLGTGDKLLLIIIMLLWLRYSWRVVAIVKGYPDMSPGPEPENKR
jgi:hypothetical protein